MIPIRSLPAAIKYPRKNIDKICLSPFVGIEVTTEGLVRMCSCSGWMPTVVGNLFEQSLEQILSSPRACEIRRSIIDGTYEFCNEQSCGLIQNNLLNDAHNVPAKVQPLLADSGCFNLPHEISLAGDTVCNLSCPSCRSGVISPNEAQQEQQQALAKKLAANLFSNATEDPMCINLSNSGEVFASPMLMEFLQSIESDKFPNLALKIQTNALLLPSRWSRISHLHDRVKQISVSIDAATASTYHTVRRGGDWNRLIAAMQFIKEQQKVLDFELAIRMVVQQENYNEVLDFYDLGQRFEADRIEYIRIGNWWWDEQYFRQQDVLDPAHPLYREARNMTDKLHNLPKVWISGGNFQ